MFCAADRAVIGYSGQLVTLDEAEKREDQYPVVCARPPLDYSVQRTGDVEHPNHSP